VGLDAPVADYLPEFGLDRRITVRMLLQHTSGLFDTPARCCRRDGRAGILGGQEFVGQRFTLPAGGAGAVRVVQACAVRAGNDWSYANINYVLAGLLIEKVTGRPYGDELQRRILRPLGWGHRGAGTSPGIPGRTPWYYRTRTPGSGRCRHQPPEPLLGVQRR